MAGLLPAAAAATRLVHEFADSQFGHLFARGGDRETARRHMTVRFWLVFGRSDTVGCVRLRPVPVPRETICGEFFSQSKAVRLCNFHITFLSCFQDEETAVGLGFPRHALDLVSVVEIGAICDGLFFM